jgi:hypothetical protein
VRAPRRVTIVLRASKQTAAWLTARDRAGHVVLARRLVLGRAGARILLPVRRAGRHTLTLDARAINGRAARATAVVTATPPPPRPHRRKRTARDDRDARPSRSDGGRTPSAAEKRKGASQAADKATAQAHGRSRRPGPAS